MRGMVHCVEKLDIIGMGYIVDMIYMVPIIDNVKVCTKEERSMKILSFYLLMS